VSMIYHPATGIDIGDPELSPLEATKLPSKAEVAAAASSLILSASGWRKVFASPIEGDPRAPWSVDNSPDDSLSIRISKADSVIAALMAATFGRFILESELKGGPAKPSILLGIDSRPTGPVIADIFARVLLGMGIDVRYSFIVPAPEIMAAAGKDGTLPADDPRHISGFAYISASHNPPGHNGVKFGMGTGGVMSATQIAPLIAGFKAAIDVANPALDAFNLVEAARQEDIAACFEACTTWKRHSLSDYTLFAQEVITGESEMDDQSAYLDTLAEACGKRPLGIVAELNGSARSVSIDKDFFEGPSIRAKFYNDQPRLFGHRIVPEGKSLSLCVRLLGEAHAADPCFQLGYVPDCDGDRGNLVFYDKALGKARVLEAQEVFSLSCLAELAHHGRSGKSARLAVVVNDATSMRIERIAGFFGAKVFRAETGEANVVNLAETLRSEGWTVRILGEGSNGGNITHPSKGRDPLSTLGAMIRLLRLPDEVGVPNLYRVWLKACGQESAYRQDYDLADIIATLPAWVTTSVFEERAALRVRSADKVALKARYAAIFAREWERIRPELERRFGIVAWKAFATNGTEERAIGADFGASGQGGLRIVLEAADGAPKAFLWMRGSGTEPVFRIMADIEGGGQADEEYLLAWQAGMVAAADE